MTVPPAPKKAPAKKKSFWILEDLIEQRSHFPAHSSDSWAQSDSSLGCHSASVVITGLRAIFLQFSISIITGENGFLKRIALGRGHTSCHRVCQEDDLARCERKRSCTAIYEGGKISKPQFKCLIRRDWPEGGRIQQTARCWKLNLFFFFYMTGLHWFP